MTNSIGTTLQALARAHRARMAQLLAPHGLHAGQDALLMVVWDQPGLRQATLADKLGVERPTVTRMVQRLERAGMIERQADPHDARSMRVLPSARSRLLEPTVRRLWSVLETDMINVIGAAEADRLQRSMAAVLARVSSSG